MSALLKQHAELLQLASFRQALGPLEGYVNLKAAETDRNGVLNGSPDAGDRVWQVLNLAYWLKSRNLQLA